MQTLDISNQRCTRSMTLDKKSHRPMDAYDVLGNIIEINPQIIDVSIITPRLSPQIQERTDLSSDEMVIIRAAHELKSKSGISFWDAAMVSAASSEIRSSGIFKAACYHNDAGAARQIPARLVRDPAFRRYESELQYGSILAVRSRVKCEDGRYYHIPQIDFHCAESESSRRASIEVIQTCNLRGYLLRSGKSYHFYGNNLIPEEDFSKFMGKILLFSPIVDRAWIAHQLIEGQSALRLSSRPGYGTNPQLVQEIPGDL
jgi:hypothetical protein